ncbi:VOC family protein [Mycolicibacterium sp.]|uniref:VOC family protein n=1 Tax=Mycolicibacterium sp. TaxID=2320850 RepID=UPI003D1312BF
MPVRDHAPLGAPIWTDLTTSDLDRAQQFYAAVFGWTFDTAGPELGGYVTAARNDRPVVGLVANDPQWNSPDGWTTYLHTADVRATMAAAAAAGAVTCAAGAEPMEVPGRGTMGLMADPTGAFFGLWQPGGHGGTALVDEHGVPVYHQLCTTDYGAALAFYRDVLGWHTETVSDTDEFRYSTAAFDGRPLIGVMSEGVSGWSVFFGCDDVDKTVAVIVDNGGRVIRAAEDTPYGRLAAVADPTGAEFNLAPADPAR